MKKCILLFFALCTVLSACSNSQSDSTETHMSKTEVATNEAATSVTEYVAVLEPAITIYPLPDSTMDTLNNATLAISLEEGDAYVDDAGVMRMDVKIYSYDLFDMVDISGLKAGDTIVTHSGKVEISSIERNEFGTILINGGLEYGGFDLFSSNGGVYYEVGFSDTKNWYEVGSATLRVSADLEFRDNIDLEKGEQIYYAGSFLVGEVINYHFTPYNTTIRTENGQIVSMERIYTP